jgi:hypothetical protein
MDELLLSLGVIGLFILRIGVPMLILIGIGIAIDRWQSSREKKFQSTPYQESQSSADR